MIRHDMNAVALALPTRSVRSCSLADRGRHAEACFEVRAFRPWLPTATGPILLDAEGGRRGLIGTFRVEQIRAD